MDSRTKSKRGLPKGFPFKGDIEVNNIHSTKLFFPKEQSGNMLADKRNVSKQLRSFVIIRGYSEPLGFDLIDNVLMQRDFIID
ncbi:MAG: hypothetical protein HKP41_10345 [Desulfobacterales bacterium]|nr:hypothetical protein [Desulfobacterales bacterium]